MTDSRFWQIVPARYPVPGIGKWFKNIGLTSKFPNTRSKHELLWKRPMKVSNIPSTRSGKWLMFFRVSRVSGHFFDTTLYKVLTCAIPVRGYRPGIGRVL